MKVLKYLLIVLAARFVQSANILGVFPAASVSHQIVYQPIWRELSLRGHNVVVITPNPLNDSSLTNLTEIDVSFLYERTKTFMAGIKGGSNHWLFWPSLMEFQTILAGDLLGYSEVSALLRSEETKFDVVIAEFLEPTVAAYAYRFKCPFIGVTSLSILTQQHEAIGNGAHPLLNPDILTPFGEDLTFLEKVDASLFSLYIHYKYYTHFLPLFDANARKHFGDDMPYLGDLERNASIVLLNTNPVLHGAKAHTTAVIEMGRMHLKKKKALPQDLRKFLDDSKEGIIYFSLGSNVKSININENKRNLLIETFSEVPYKVLWKFENDTLQNQPRNVRISKWLPQQDMLGHPNIKLFVTQAGLQSTEEAIANEVPLLALPFAFDQHSLAKRIANLGIGLNLDFDKLTKERFKEAILEVTQNPEYKWKIREINQLMNDQPMSGLERAVWWTEYVIRHRGAPYFRNRMVDVPWYEYFLVDVIGSLLLIILLVVSMIYRIIRHIIRRILHCIFSRKLKRS